MPTPIRPPCPVHSQPQHGVALLVVLVLVMLTLLLALWASRSALFNELIVGNEADYQRALEAAQALLQDAELDIRGERANGSACTPDSSKPKVCRNGTGVDKVPQTDDDVTTLLAALSQQATQCRNALCTKRSGKQDFWNNTSESAGVTLAQMMADGIGAYYGQFTGAITGDASNPILKDTGKNRYWIEIMRYDAKAGRAALIAGAPNHLKLHLKPNVVYRITALAYGRKSNTLVVLQQTYARHQTQN